MPADVLAPPGAGRVVVNPSWRERLAALGLDTAAALLDLPGEVVSGHPDRHVVRVEVPGLGTCYLKRQHRVGLGERCRQWLAGFGWVSRCEREAAVIRGLEAAGFPAPGWVAVGEHAGRAYLLVEELDGVELRRLLSDDRLSPSERRRLAARLGEQVGRLHAAGFDTPDLTAKHVFVDGGAFEMTLIDWQNARRAEAGRAGPTARAEAGTAGPTALAALHASLADDLATPRERLRFLQAYVKQTRTAERFSVHARRIGRLAAKLSRRRSIRDQRQPAAVDQRLVWLAGEAVCAVPDIATTWPDPPVCAPFYTGEPGMTESRIALPDGRPAVLVRGRSLAPFARLRAWLRGRPWRSPGVTAGRVLFHLERYGVPAPHLYAFGQCGSEWFALFEPADGTPPSDAECRDLLDRLHAAGCRTAGLPFRVVNGRPVVADPRAIAIVRRTPRNPLRAR